MSKVLHLWSNGKCHLQEKMEKNTWTRRGLAPWSYKFVNTCTRHMSFATQGAPSKRVFARGTAQGCSLVIQKWWMLMRWFGSKSSFGGSMPCMSGSFCWDMMDVQVKSSKRACKNSKSSQDGTAKRETLGAIFPYIRTIDWTSCWYFTWYLPWCQISRHHEKHLIFAQPDSPRCWFSLWAPDGEGRHEGFEAASAASIKKGCKHAVNLMVSTVTWGSWPRFPKIDLLFLQDLGISGNVKRRKKEKRWKTVFFQRGQVTPKSHFATARAVPTKSRSLKAFCWIATG